MSKVFTLTLAAFLLQSLLVTAQNGSDVLRFVNPLIGTANGGHVFPGATLPFGMHPPSPHDKFRLTKTTGMAKAVADVNGDNEGGFAADNSNITGFSHMHDSGTGGVSHTFAYNTPQPSGC